jgi:hypothetical protein
MGPGYIPTAADACPASSPATSTETINRRSSPWLHVVCLPTMLLPIVDNVIECRKGLGLMSTTFDAN